MGAPYSLSPSGQDSTAGTIPPTFTDGGIAQKKGTRRRPCKSSLAVMTALQRLEVCKRAPLPRRNGIRAGQSNQSGKEATSLSSQRAERLHGFTRLSIQCCLMHKVIKVRMSTLLTNAVSDVAQIYDAMWCFSGTAIIVRNGMYDGGSSMSA
jgi:hypothetical protein